jgi:hypothetical protein
MPNSTRRGARRRRHSRRSSEDWRAERSRIAAADCAVVRRAEPRWRFLRLCVRPFAKACRWNGASARWAEPSSPVRTFSVANSFAEGSTACDASNKGHDKGFGNQRMLSMPLRRIKLRMASTAPVGRTAPLQALKHNLPRGSDKWRKPPGSHRLARASSECQGR